MFFLFCFFLVPSATGTHYEVAATNPPAAGSGGRQLRLERGSLWAQQGRKAPDFARNAPGNRETPQTAAESPTRAGECLIDICEVFCSIHVSILGLQPKSDTHTNL